MLIIWHDGLLNESAQQQHHVFGRHCSGQAWIPITRQFSRKDVLLVYFQSVGDGFDGCKGFLGGLEGSGVGVRDNLLQIFFEEG
jgi:hypothetical protein